MLVSRYWGVGSQFFPENSIAVVGPEGQADLGRSHRELIVRGLVPCEFCAVLVGPLASGSICHYGYVLKSYGIVLIIGNAFGDTIVSHSLQLGVHAQAGIRNEHITEFNATSILYANCVDVSQVEKEIALYDLWFGNIKDLREDV